MERNPDTVKQILDAVIDEMAAKPEEYVNRPGKDFTRNRKLGLGSLSRFLLSMQGNSIGCELEKYFEHEMDTPTASAFVQQRAKLSPEFFPEMLRRFNEHCDDSETYKGYKLYAVDGTFLNVSRDKAAESFVDQPGTEGHNLLHINALYDLCSGTYKDCVIQPISKVNERAGLVTMLHRNDFNQKSVVIVDRGYFSYNVFAHFLNTPNVDFVCRIKQGQDTLRDVRSLPMKELDCFIEPEITTTQTNEDKKLNRIHISIAKKQYKTNRKTKYTVWDFGSPYKFHLRVVRFRIADNPDKHGNVEDNPDNYETIITSLDPKEFPVEEIKKLYGMRWGVETSFRTLKYAVGMVNLHAKNEDFVAQEIYAHLIMYNFCVRIAACTEVVQKGGKYEYQINLTMAVQLCRAYWRARLEAQTLTEKLQRYILPIRPGRQDKRKLRPKVFVSFLYRVAA